MHALKFKTNIQCGGCIATVTPYLDKQSNVGYWEVDTTNPDKILTIESDSLQAGEVIAALNQAGYRAAQI